MGFLRFEDLLKEYSSQFEKDYIKNEKKHPTFSILRNSYWNLSIYYYFINLLFIAIVIVALFPILWIGLRVILYLLYNISINSFVLLFIEIYFFKGTILTHLTVYLIPSLIGTLGIFIFLRYIKFPKLDELWFLGDRVNLIRSRIQLAEFDLSTIKNMILNADDIYSLEAKAYLKKYYELIQPKIDGNKNKAINKDYDRIVRLVVFDILMKNFSVKYSQEETVFLLSSLLMISQKDFGNVKSQLTLLDKIKRNEDIKVPEDKRREVISFVKKASMLLEESLKETNGIYKSLKDKK